MKVHFSRLVDYTPVWNGNRDLPEAEQCKCKLKPMETDDLINLMDQLQSAAGGEVDRESLTALAESGNISRMKEMLEACGDLIPKYTEIEGLEDVSGPVSPEDLVKYPYYMELSAEILGELANISMPSEVEEKNSEPQPGTQSTPTQ